MMKALSVKSALLLALITLVSSGCTAIGGIFKAGIWTGIILVLFVVFVIVVLFNKKK